MYYLSQKKLSENHRRKEEYNKNNSSTDLDKP